MSKDNETPFGSGTNESENDAETGLEHGRRLDAALRSALRREQPPQGFAERVEARIAAANRAPAQSETVVGFRESSSVGRFTGRGSDRSGMRANLAQAAVLLLAVTVPLGWRLHHQAEMARGQAAKEQVMLALRITGTQLRSIQERTQSINAGGMPGGETQ